MRTIRVMIRTMTKVIVLMTLVISSGSAFAAGLGEMSRNSQIPARAKLCKQAVDLAHMDANPYSRNRRAKSKAIELNK